MNKAIRKISPIIFVFSLIGSNLFFSISSIIGYEYAGIDSSPIFLLYHMIIFILSIFLLFIDIINRRKISTKELLIYMLPLLLLINYLLFSLKGFNSYARTWFLYYILWGVPATYIGIYFSKDNNILKLRKIFKYIMIVFSISSLIALITLLNTGNRSNFGGANYQTTSYIAAFSYGLSMFYLLCKQNINNKNVFYKIVLIIFSLSNFITTIMYGGRGAFVLLLVYSTYFIFSYIKDKGIKKVLTPIILIVLFLIVSSILIKTNQIISIGFERATAFLGEGLEIDWDGTSGRDNVYKKAILLIKDKPILGYGLFGYWKVMPNPHNIFLEILLGGGIIVFILSLLFFLYLLIKTINVTNENKETNIIIVLILYPVIMLMFSGSYLTNSLFWMTIILLINYKIGGIYNDKNITYSKEDGPGGVQNLLMTWYRNIDKTKFKFDFLTQDKSPGYYDEEIKSLGGRVFYGEPLYKNKLKYIKNTRAFLKKNQYDFIHIHNNFSNIYTIFAARRLEVKTISHSHAANPEKNILKKILKIFATKYINKHSYKIVACSEVSGNWLYGQNNFKKRGVLIRNAINVDVYRYDAEIRLDKRKELLIDSSTILVGNVSNYSLVKNHEFLFQVFLEIIKIYPNSTLILVGRGEKEFLRLAKKYNIEDKVIITGPRNDIDELLQAIDIFVFPSFYEGAGISLLEAQLSGIPSIASNTIDRDIKVADAVIFEPLDSGPSVWSQKILKLFEDYNRIESNINFKKYDIMYEMQKIEKLYKD